MLPSRLMGLGEVGRDGSIQHALASEGGCIWQAMA
jgi:hypothetical protein